MGHSAVLDMWDEAEKEEFSLFDYTGFREKDLILTSTLGTTPVIFSAPHATKQVREGELRQEERGIGGLAEVLAHATSSTYIAMGGRQTGDPNWDEKHPYKDSVQELVEDYGLRILFDLHGMDLQPAEVTSADIEVGLGPNISVTSGFIVDALKTRGKQLGIEVSVGSSAFTELCSQGVVATAAHSGLTAVQLTLAPQLRFGEGNDERRLAAFRLIASVAADTVSSLPVLDQLTFQSGVMVVPNQPGKAAVLEVANKVAEALGYGVSLPFIHNAILLRASFKFDQLGLFFSADLDTKELRQAGELMREWALARMQHRLN